MPFDFTTRRNICPTEAGGSTSKLYPATIPPSVVDQVITPDEGWDGFNQVTVPAVRLENISINPSTQVQNFNPSGENLGFNTITVNPVTASIDPNLTSQNLKRGVSVLGVNGTIDVDSMYNTTFQQIYGVVDENGVLDTEAEKLDIVLDGVREIRGSGFAWSYSHCHKLNSFVCPDLENVSGFRNAFGGDWIDTASTIKLFSAPKATIISGTTNAFQGCRNCNFYCPNVTTIGPSGLWNTFINTRNMSIYLPNVREIKSSGMFNTFWNSSVSWLDFGNLRRVYSNGLQYTFSNKSTYNGIYNFPSLYGAGDGAFYGMFYGSYYSSTSNGHLYFPALIPEFYEMYSGTRNKSQFKSMLYNTTNVTVHFPSNLEPIINTWEDVLSGFGGKQSKILFDLSPASEPEEEYVIEDGVLIDYAFSHKPLVFNNVNIIGEDALSLCRGYMGSANEISFSNVEVVQSNGLNQAFRNNCNIISFDLPKLTTIYEYGMYYAFADCNSLTSFNAPNLTTVYYNTSYYSYTHGLYGAFTNCTNLTSLNLCNLTNLPSLGFFSNCPNLVTLNLHSLQNLTYLNGAFSGCSSLVNLDIDNIDLTNKWNTSYMFNGCKKLTNIATISQIVDLLGIGNNSNNYISADRSHMFQYSGIIDADFNNLSSNIYNAYANYTCDHIFYGCQNLTTVNLSKFKGMASSNQMVVQNIFRSAFENCPNLISVDFSGLANLSGCNHFYRAFANNPNLTTVDFNNLYSLGSSWSNNSFSEAFQNDISLTTLSFERLYQPGYYGFYNAFYGCNNLTDLYFYNINTTSYSRANAYSFVNMMCGCDSVNIHFKETVNEEYFRGWDNGFGGTNITILKDL